MIDNGGVTFSNVSFTPPSRAPHTAAEPVLQGISLELATGTATALLGRSGSGKTTLLRMVNGLVLPTGGSVTTLGTVLHAGTSAGTVRGLRRRVGYVIQETGLFPHMSIERNVALPLELAGLPQRERSERARALLETVGLAAARYAERLPHELSGGQRQRVGLARALAGEPRLLLLDEPFGALDPLTRAEMQRMLGELLARYRMTALMVTHDVQEALIVADRVLFLREGTIAADLPAGDVTTSRDSGVQEYLQAAHRVLDAHAPRERQP